MSYLVMRTVVTIGDIVIKNINSFHIKEDIEKTSDEAQIIIARNYKQLQDKSILYYIKSGDKVTIQTGYDNDLQTEFTGFVRTAPDVDFPITVYCDELWTLRQNNHVLNFKDITLKDLLTKIAPGYQIECPDMHMGKIHIPNWSSYRVLVEIKKVWGFFSRINGNTLSVGFAYDFSSSFTKKHTYTIGNNVRNHKKLRYSTDVDFNVQVNLRVHLPNGKTLLVKKDTGHTGQDVKVQVLNCYNKPLKEAENLAKAQLQKLLYNGYSGQIDGFCLERTHAGDSLTIVNPAYPEREGTFLIEKVNIIFEESKIVRENFITYKLS
jgi:hypothetical protein